MRNGGRSETTPPPGWRRSWTDWTTRRRHHRPRHRPLRLPAVRTTTRSGRNGSRGRTGELRLDPETGDPTDKLRQILQDAAG